MQPPQNAERHPTSNSRDPVDSGRADAGALRRWLIVLSVLAVVPWLVTGIIYYRTIEPPAQPHIPPDGTVLTLKDGPWGRLTAIPVVVSPPIEYVSTSASDVDWYLPGLTPDQAVSFLAAQGLTPVQISELRSRIRVQPEIKGVAIAPTPSIVRSLTPDVRARLYQQLAKVRMNRAQFDPFRYQTASPDGWLWGQTIAPATRARVEPLLYRNGESLFFADLELLRGELDDAELLRLAKVLNRRPTYILRLMVGPRDVEPLADYWGIGGRRTDMRALLESMSTLRPEQRLDIIHLLPSLARDRMYRFARVTGADYERPVIANCLWTALNFFNQVPDDKFLDVNYALETLKRDYYIVQNNFRLGDIVGFVAENDSLFHAAVYLADDFVFTKNGTNPMAPWAIMRLDEVREVYRGRSDKATLIFHRYQGF
jgi:hypothetical protein